MTTKKKAERLTTEEKQTIAALAANGKSSRAIARATGRDNKTILKALKDSDVIIDKAKIEERMAGNCELLADAILESVSEDDLRKASLQQKTISAATLIDKARLIRGQSTQNLAVVYANAVIEADRLAQERAKQEMAIDAESTGGE